MAIKIPSKNIYEISNPKIRDNVIGNVQIYETKVLPDNHYDEVVHNEKIETINSINDDIQTNSDLVGEKVNYVGETMYRIKYRYIDLQSAHTIGYKIVIPKLKENSYISEVLVGKNKDDKPNINCSIHYDYIEYPILGSLVFNAQKNNTDLKLTIQSLSFDRSGDNTVENSGVGGLPTSFSHTFTYITGAGNPITKTLYVENKSNLTSEDIFTEDNDNFYFNLSFLTTAKFQYLQYFTQVDYFSFTSGDHTVAVGGKAIEYIPKQVDITFYGNTIGIDLTDGSVSYIKSGSSLVEGTSDKPFTLEGNELMQESSSIIGLDNYNNTKYRAGWVLIQYEKGKETATLLCDISDYYDESGNKIIDISSDQMTFREHDLVIPYVYGADGIDKPMSKYQDGTPKVFEVTKTRKIYDGAVWQELTLQEKK